MRLERRRILLELEPGSDPIAGSVTVARAEPEEFRGWIELTELLERLNDVAKDPN